MKEKLSVNFKTLVQTMMLGTVLVLGTGLAAAEEAETQSGMPVIVEGTHYNVLPVPVRTRYPDKIEVTEYFSYLCPHCYQFDPTLSAWVAKLPNDVVFNRTPAVWDQQAFLVLAQSYYTAEALGVTDKVHLPLFNAIHGERKNLSDPQSVAAFFNQFGVDVEDFAKVYHSFGVRAATQQAIARGRSYRATGVPTLIVNGRYRVEGSHAGSNTGMLPIVELLIEKERARVRGVEQE